MSLEPVDPATVLEMYLADREASSRKRRCSAYAAEATRVGLTGLSGGTFAAMASMFIGATTGLTTERVNHGLE